MRVGGASRFGEAHRLAAAYVALFFTAGVYMPYWPVWLAARGLGAQEVGLFLGVGGWARIVVPWLGAWVDRTGKSARAIAIAGGSVFATFLVFEHVHGFVALAALTLVLGVAYAPLIPLLDGIAISASAAGRLDYGRVRLWGSASFIAASVAGGAVLEGRDPSLVLRGLQASAAVLFLATLWVAHGSAPAVARTPAKAGERDAVGDTPGIVVFLACASCLMAAHGVLYGFATKHWQNVGIEESTIGWFWGVGVIAEVVLFALGTRVVAWIGPRGLLIVAGIGGVVRWAGLGSTSEVPITFLIQLLHATTFGALHLGAMAWVRSHVAPGAIHRATSLYVALPSGAALALSMSAGGWLFERFAGQAYYAMFGLAVIGAVLAWRVPASPRVTVRGDAT